MPRKLLYAEDRVRAQFYRQFGDTLEVYDLTESGGRDDSSSEKNKTLVQQLVDKFDAVATEERTFAENFVAAVDALELDGVRLRAMDPQMALRGTVSDARRNDRFGDGSFESVRRERRAARDAAGGDGEGFPQRKKLSFRDIFAAVDEAETTAKKTASVDSSSSSSDSSSDSSDSSDSDNDTKK